MFENRRSYRLPFKTKFVVSSDTVVLGGTTMNMSLGGTFIRTMRTEVKRDESLKCLFMLQEGQEPFWIHATVARVVFPSADPTEVPGIGIRFSEMAENDFERIRYFMEEMRGKYELASTLLSSGEPDIQSLGALIEDLKLSPTLDLSELRFEVDQVVKSIEITERNLGRDQKS